MQAAGADPLAVARACEAVKGFADARQLTAIHQVCLEDPAVLDPQGRMCDPATAEIACALYWTPGVAGQRVNLAVDLCENLPQVLAALRCGLLDVGKARQISLGTCELDPHDRTGLAAAACEYAAGHTLGQLRAWLARQVAAIDSEAARRRRAKARKRRRVWVQPESDGMATLGAYLTAEEAQACLASLKAAAGNHEGGVDAARADLLVERITGIAPGVPVPVQVIITADGPELAGHGPISHEHADRLGAKPTKPGHTARPRPEYTEATVLHPPGPSPHYRPSPALARYVKARDRHCRFPGCRRPAVNCDIDHLVPWPDGPTSASNTAALCRRHHRIKTHTNWQVKALPGNTLQWTSPRGHTYLTTLHDP